MKDIIDDCIQTCSITPVPHHLDTNSELHNTETGTPQIDAGHTDTMTSSSTTQHIASTAAANPNLVEDMSGDYLQRMLTSYEELGGKLACAWPYLQ